MHFQLTIFSTYSGFIGTHVGEGSIFEINISVAVLSNAYFAPAASGCQTD